MSSRASSGSIAVRVEDVKKSYRIMHQQHSTLGETILAKIRNPFSTLGQARETFFALKGISLEVKKGEVLGIIGANGAGKSTLLKILTRITMPTAGRVDLYGRVGSLLEVGTGFHPELTGHENIYLNGAILGMSRTEVRRKFEEIVDFAGVEKFLDTPVKRYSSGMYVRLAFAVAAHLEPEILIVDEVLAVGDAEFQDKCMDRMKVVSSHGRTVLFVSHNMAAVRSLCEKVMVLDHGTALFSGTAEESVSFYMGRAGAGSGLVWTRPAGQAAPNVGFEKISVSLGGKQPELTLRFEVKVRCLEQGDDVFLAFDIRDEAQTPLMQVLPQPRPFLRMTPGLHEVAIEANLPPLIPGRYLIDAWVGSHYTVTDDHVHNAVAFEVAEGPVLGRSFPYPPDHGRVFPVSRLLTQTKEMPACPA